MAAKYALSLICEGQVGVGEASTAYARLARMYRSQAEYIATCTKLEVDTTGTGIGTIVIDLSTCNPLEG